MEENSKDQEFFDMLVEQIKERDKRTAFLIYVLAQVLKQNNSESGDHLLHIRIIIRIILEALRKIDKKYNLSDDDIASISVASCLHDIGKVKIPGEILNKPGKLTDSEFLEIQKHTILGEQLLTEYEEFKDDKLLKFAKEICRWHHEKWDGNGYPDGLIGDQIPIWAQAASLADCYDALTSVRCYKEKYSHEDAVRMILDGECGQFNPDMLEAFKSCSDKIKRKVQVNNPVEMDADQDAKRFADAIIKKHKQYL